MSSDSGKAAAYLLMGMLFGVGGYLYGLALYRIYKLIQYTPTSKSVAAAPGLCEVAGQAQPDGELQTAPFARKPCVFYRTNIYQWSGSGKHRRRELAACLKGRNRFYLQDESGRIAIEPPTDKLDVNMLNAGWNLLAKHRESPQDYLKIDVKDSSAGRGGLQALFGARNLWSYYSNPGLKDSNEEFLAKRTVYLQVAMILFIVILFWFTVRDEFLVLGLIAILVITYLVLLALSRLLKPHIGNKETAKEPVPPQPHDKVRKFLATNYPSLAGYHDRVDVEETYIEPGDSIYVLGTAKAADGDPDGISVRYSPDNGIFCISDGSEKDARKKAGWGAYLWGLGGPILFGICAVLLFKEYVKGGLGDTLAAFVLPLVLLMYAVFVLINLLEIYNGTVRLRQNIDKASANIDALYQMRHELVPQLAEVVQAASRHEKNLQKELAGLRAARMEEAGKRLLAVAENYPVLQADQNFLLLQNQLAEIQEKLAGSQAYLVDATTLYNRRVQSFPYFLFTPIMGLQSMPMPSFSPD